MEEITPDRLYRTHLELWQPSYGISTLITTLSGLIGMIIFFLKSGLFGFSSPVYRLHRQKLTKFENPSIGIFLHTIYNLGMVLYS